MPLGGGGPEVQHRRRALHGRVRGSVTPPRLRVGATSRRPQGCFHHVLPAAGPSLVSRGDAVVEGPDLGS